MQIAETFGMLGMIEKRKSPSTVGGAATRYMLLLYRFLPRQTIINMMGRYSPVKTPSSGS
jgi:hypothetical protein